MYTIEDRTIYFGNSLNHTFDDFIAEAIDFDEAIVVRLENQGWKRMNENIFALDYRGKILWQIAPRVHAFAESHYVNIYRKNDTVEAFNWDGSILTIDPKTGEVYGQSLVYGGSSSHRVASKRQFI